MKKFKCLIVEDNTKASELLKNKIKKYCPAIDVIHQATRLDIAKEMVGKNDYELVFLDIGMPTGSGFDLIQFMEEMRADKMPEIIFTTGQNQKEYLLKAIRASAADYLYKPISNDELIHAVHKVTTSIQREQDLNNSLELLSQMKNRKSQPFDQVPILLFKGIIEYVDTAKIKYLEADGAMTTIYRTEERNLHSVRHLGYYKDYLRDHPSFFQISASVVVNLSCISRYEHSRLLLTFKDGETIHASKRGGKDLKDFLRS